MDNPPRINPGYAPDIGLRATKSFYGCSRVCVMVVSEGSTGYSGSGVETMRANVGKTI